MEQTEFKKKQYQQWVKEASPGSHLAGNCARAFLAGGFICVLGQMLNNWLMAQSVAQDDARMLTSVILITAGIILTGLGWYDKLGEHAGAGTIVPITGFANSIAAPAIEFKKEGLVLGVGAKMFVIAGPVIVYGTLTSVVVGLLYYFFK